MDVRNRWGPRGKRPVRPQLKPEQLAANHQLALQWREEWRAECSGAPQRPPVSPDPEPPPERRRDELKHRAQFAEGIARLEFGRAYWDEKRQSRSKKPAARSLKFKEPD
jgi:hypothetical protein